MKHLFLDTNVIIDFLADRKPFAESASQLFSLGTDKKVKIYCSAISFNNIYYLFRQSHTHAPAIQLLKDLAGMIEIVAFGKNIVSQSLQSGFRDFEDAIQYHSALSVPKLDGIVTRNTRDFSKSKLSVLTPTEALSLFS
jgi:predicted nucleic acid-binding protein